jgi:hypothetical protein
MLLGRAGISSANAETSAGTSHGIQFFRGSTSGPFIAISVYRISSKRRWIIEKISIEKTIMRLIRRTAAKAELSSTCCA